MSRPLTTGALLELARPLNALITGLTVMVGGILAGKGSVFSFQLLIAAAFSAALIAAGGNSLNDAFDVVIDIVNRPRRPIPSGRISRLTACWWGGFLMITGVVLGWVLGYKLGLIATAVAGLLWLYSASLKRLPLIGNLAVSLCGGLAFIYGGLVVGHAKTALIPAGFALLIHFGREIIKDVEDIIGDKAAGAHTLPILIGRSAALGIAAVILLLLAALTLAPYKFGIYGVRYLRLVVVFVVLPLVVVAGILLKGAGRGGLNRISLALKIIMLFGLGALYAG